MASDDDAWIVADTCWHSTRNLLATWPPASAPGARLLRLEPIDWRNARARGISWRAWGVHTCELSSQVSLTTAELPPGWMKTFPKLGQWPLARAARTWQRGLEPKPRATTLWMTYPFYVALAEMVRPDRAIYYVLDDYTLYWPSKADLVREWEARAVERADFTVCVAAEMAHRLQDRFPDSAGKILHIPHGAPEWTIPAEPLTTPMAAPPELADIPRPILGYLGGLEDRVDWPLVGRLAAAFPEVSVVLVGPKPDIAGASTWQRSAAEAVRMPNVYVRGPIAQERIGEVYASFDVNLVPYDASHPFNVACSPTKLMDAMGSGRPMVATALPECRQHAERIDVAADHDAFLAAIDRLKTRGFRDGREVLRHRFACDRRTAAVLDELYRLT